MVRRLLAALTALFVAGTLFAQNYKISLKLEDATNGEPVGFATVSATPEKGDALPLYRPHLKRETPSTPLQTTTAPPPWKNSVRGSTP